MTTYILCLTIGTTVFTAANWKYAEMMFVDHGGYPGGTIAFFMAGSSVWANILSSSAFICNNVLVDGLIVR